MAVFSEQQHQQSMDRRRKEKLAAHRAATGTSWLIRDDGTIFPNTPLMAARKNMRPYHGDIKASLEQRMAALKGAPGRRGVVFDEPEPLNITKASKEELIAFAMDEYEHTIEPDEHINKVRAIVCKLVDLDYNEVFGGGSRVRTGSEPAGLQLGA